MGKIQSLRDQLNLCMLTEYAEPQRRDKLRDQALRSESATKTAVRLGAAQVASTFPGLAARISGYTPRTQTGLRFVGYGAECTVLRDGDVVRKVTRVSERMAEPAKYELAERKTADHSMLYNYLPDITLRQTVAVEPHPLAPKRTAVITTQAYTPFEDTGIFDVGIDTPGHVDIDALNAVCQRYPGIDAALGDLITGTRVMCEEVGKVPDFYGKENLVITNLASPELTMIDGQPMDDTYGFNHIARTAAGLTTLERALWEVAA